MECKKLERCFGEKFEKTNSSHVFGDQYKSKTRKVHRVNDNWWLFTRGNYKRYDSFEDLLSDHQGIRWHYGQMCNTYWRHMRHLQRHHKDTHARNRLFLIHYTLVALEEAMDDSYRQVYNRDEKWKSYLDPRPAARMEKLYFGDNISYMRRFHALQG